MELEAALAAPAHVEGDLSRAALAAIGGIVKKREWRPDTRGHGLYLFRYTPYLIRMDFPESIEGMTMITLKDPMTAEIAMDTERRRDLARVDAGAPSDKPGFAKKTHLPGLDEQNGSRRYAPSSAGFMASRALAKAASGKAGRPAAHGHSRHK